MFLYSEVMFYESGCLWHESYLNMLHGSAIWQSVLNMSVLWLFLLVTSLSVLVILCIVKLKL
jgi:hypothetical protein